MTFVSSGRFAMVLVFSADRLLTDFVDSKVGVNEALVKEGLGVDSIRGENELTTVSFWPGFEPLIVVVVGKIGFGFFI